MTSALVSAASDGLGLLVRHVLQPLMLPVVERNLVPDLLVRAAIRRELVEQRLNVTPTPPLTTP